MSRLIGGSAADCFCHHPRGRDTHRTAVAAGFHPVDDVIVNEKSDFDFIAASGIAATANDVRTLQVAFVPWTLEMIQQYALVELFVGT